MFWKPAWLALTEVATVWLALIRLLDAVSLADDQVEVQLPPLNKAANWLLRKLCICDDVIVFTLGDVVAKPNVDWKAASTAVCAALAGVWA